jgi:hypothetical protein
MDLLKHPFDELVYLILYTPWWVYFIFIYCIIMGWKARKARVVSFYRLFLIPLFIAIWTLHGYFVHYILFFPHLLAWFASLTGGAAVGWWAYRHKSIQADKVKKLIKLPGSWSTLFVILLIFFTRYYFQFVHAIDPLSGLKPAIVYTDLTLTSFLLGIILGRGLYYSHAYRKAPHTDLHRF